MCPREGGGLHGPDWIGFGVGNVVNRLDVRKHFRIDVTYSQFEVARDVERIRRCRHWTDYAQRAQTDRAVGTRRCDASLRITEPYGAERTSKPTDLYVRLLIQRREWKVGGARPHVPAGDDI